MKDLSTLMSVKNIYLNKIFDHSLLPPFTFLARLMYAEFLLNKSKHLFLFLVR